MTDGAAIASIVVVLDCADAERLADFWSAALGYPRRQAVTQFVVLSPPEGETRPTLILQQVPEPKGVKNRMHMDLHAADRDAAVERLAALGARKIRSSRTASAILLASHGRSGGERVLRRPGLSATPPMRRAVDSPHDRATHAVHLGVGHRGAS